MPDSMQSRNPARALWNRNFLLLWSGQSISELGSTVTAIALPLIAVEWLRVSTFQVGLLSAAGTVAFLAIALPAGLIVDLVARRKIMLWCDLARMAIIASVPLMAMIGKLTLGWLYLVAVSAGMLTVFFDVAYQSFLPGLLDRSQLMEGNGKLGISQALAQVCGPGLASVLVALSGAARTMTADAASFGISAVSLLLIRVPVRSADIPGKSARSPLRHEVVKGLIFILRHPVLRKITACTATANLFIPMAIALEIIYLVRVLHARLVLLGFLLSVVSLGGVIGGVLAGPLGRRIGSARMIWVSLVGLGPVGLLVPLAAPGWRLALFPLGWAGFNCCTVLYNTAQLSYRQAICPPELLGRMNAAVRWIVWGTLPLGGLAGGAVGTALGIRTTLWIAFGGACASGLWVLFSPLRGMRDIPVREVHVAPMLGVQPARQ